MSRTTGPGPLAIVSRRLGGMNGVDRVAEVMIGGLAETGMPVTVVSVDPPGDRWLEAGKAGNPPRWVPAPKEVDFPRRIDRRLPRRLASWAKWGLADRVARRRLTGIRPAATVVHSLGSLRPWCTRELGGDGPTLLVVHESPRHFGGPHREHALASADARMASCSHLAFVSARCRDEWLSRPALRDKPGYHVSNCCDESAVAAVRSEPRSVVRSQLGWAPDRAVAVCVASIQPRKGQDILVEHAPELFAALPHLDIVCAGAPVRRGEWHDDLDRRLQALGSPDRIRFVGPRADALRLIYAADLLLLPSRAEALPLTVLEAMALGTPVVAAAVDGVPELVLHGATGLLFDAVRPASIVRETVRMLSSHDPARRLAEAGRERYWTHFCRQRVVERYRAIIDELRSAPDIPAWAPAPASHEGAPCGR